MKKNEFAPWIYSCKANCYVDADMHQSMHVCHKAFLYNMPSKKSCTIGSWKGIGLNGHFKSKPYLAFKYTFLLLCVSSVVLLLDPAHSHSGTRRSEFPQGHQPKQTTERKCGPHSFNHSLMRSVEPVLALFLTHDLEYIVCYILSCMNILSYTVV